MIGAGVVAGARVTHDSAGVDDLATVDPESQRSGVAALCSVPDVEEAFVLSTCNRVEAYVVAPDVTAGEAALKEFFAAADDDVIVRTDHDESIRHLLRVAAGLESVVLGEDQIIGQVRTAYEDARSAGGIGAMLEPAVTKAIRVGERARTETAINEGVVSLGSAAARIAADELETDLADATALVVGAGEMGQVAARSFADRDVDRVIVANRTIPHAEGLVADVDVDGSAVGLDALEAAAARADVVVTATGSAEPLLAAEDFAAADRRQVVVDLGRPRDVHLNAADRPGVTVYDLDDLEAITEATRAQRADAAEAVERLIDAEFERLGEQYKRSRADDVIATMYESADRVKERELETAFERLEGMDDEQREVVRSMADALVGQLLAAPTKSLREAAAEDDWTTINTALQLFDPEFGPASTPAMSDGEFDAGTEGSEVAVDD